MNTPKVPPSQLARMVPDLFLSQPAALAEWGHGRHGPLSANLHTPRQRGPATPPTIRESIMSRDVASVFADIDAFDPDKFVAHLTPEVKFRFANADPVTGRAAVREAVGGFFATIDGLTHHIRNVWEFGDTVILQIDVEYDRKDGKTVTCRTPTS